SNALALHGLELNLPERLKNNPLLTFDALPEFASVRPEHIAPAIEFLLQYNINAVEVLTAQKQVTWSNFYAPLEEAYNMLDRAWAIATHLHSVKNSEQLRQEYTKAQKALTEYQTWYGMYQPLYDAFKKLKANKEYKAYSKAQKKAIDNALLDFQLSGVALKGEKASRYAKIVARLSELGTQFGNNVLDANMGWELVVEDRDKLAGMSEMALATAKQSAQSKGLTGYRFTLDYPSYFALVVYADDRQLRQQMFEAFRTRASDQGPTAGKWDNSAIMNEIVALRLEMAQLLGFDTYADYALARRMAESPKQVLDFLNGLLMRSQPKAKEEMAQLQEYGQSLGAIDTLQPWDVAYLSEKQKQALYNIDKEAVRVYFPEPKVLSGMFEVAKRLFGVDIKQKSGVSVWHDDVRFFEIYKDNVHVASFYLDMYARENKRGGAWMSSTIERRCNADGTIQLPVAQLVCNFGAPVDGKPALLLHDEVETLFHEFGHGLHQMLTVVDVMAVSGINGVAWDAVEFPSQMLENWTWDKEALALISAHYETGEPLPKEMVEKMLKAKNYLAASGMVRQLEYGLFDFRLNTEYQQGDETIIARLRDDIKRTVAVVHDPEWTRMAHSFTHIFSGGYAAGYYSYLWADVLATDAFSRFEEEGVLNAKVGQEYLEVFLSQGGSDSPMTMFRAFMG
ncbi:MAG: M3 family metallopeptidase, partial [Moraxella sp.]|nr:M3 family metallopeptidase [Moraxella sp.]